MCASRICRPRKRCSTGESPYPALDDPILEEQKGYVYPPQLLLAFMPLTFLPGAGRGRARRHGDAGARSGSR